MGCDYYIVKQLEVRHINDDDDEIITTVELDRERGYFFDEVDSRDSDDSSGSEDSDMRYERKYGKYLNVTYVPRVLFENGKWKNERVQKRYEDSIRDEIGNDMLLSIIKKEVRYLR
jgi:hypothetical protein